MAIIAILSAFTDSAAAFDQKRKPYTMPVQPQFLQSSLYPGDNCCTFWDYDNYSGASKTLCHNGSEVTYDMGREGFGDKDASWICGKYVAYDMCRDYSWDECRY